MCLAFVPALLSALPCVSSYVGGGGGMHLTLQKEPGFGRGALLHGQTCGA